MVMRHSDEGRGKVEEHRPSATLDSHTKTKQLCPYLDVLAFTYDAITSFGIAHVSTNGNASEFVLRGYNYFWDAP